VLKFRIILFFIFMGVYSLSFQIGATLEVSPEEANNFVQEFLSSTQDSDGLAFFVNNVSVALPMFVPGAGTIIGIYSGWSTGFGFAAIATMAPGFHVVYSLVKKVNPKSLIKPSLIEIGIVVGLLAFAGILEEYMIKLSQEGTPLL
jgi:hypothetical protein